MSTVAKWREAHPDIAIEDAPLHTMAPFPSLAIVDFIVYQESRGADADVISFLKDVAREISWVYDNWTKEQRDRDGVKLMDDLVRNIPKGEPFSDFLFRFIRDYRDGNNLNWKQPADQHAWEDAMRRPPPRVDGGIGGADGMGGAF
jgi:hypothetical protein